MTHVIIGGGIAGTTAAEELRKRDKQAEIILISDEQHPLYSRVLLPHYIKGKISRERVFLKKETWYAEQKIEWITGEEVTHVDSKNSHVELLSGRMIPYDTLLIASGSFVKFFPEDLSGVSYLRTLDDADHLVQLLATRGPQSRAAIYGGGFIACEYLNIFHEAQIPTTLLFRGPHMWSHGISAQAGALLTKHLREKGIEVVENAIKFSLQGEKTLTGVVVGEKEIPCDILGIGIGVAPYFSFLEDSGVEVKQGIVTDSSLRTNKPGVFAAGDVAEFYDERYERSFITGNWMNAQTHGRVAAASMHGEEQKVDLVSSYAMNIVGLEIIFVGDTSRVHAEEIVISGDETQGWVTEYFYRNDRLVGVILLGKNSERAAVTKWIQTQTSKEEIENR